MCRYIYLRTPTNHSHRRKHPLLPSPRITELDELWRCHFLLYVDKDQRLLSGGYRSGGTNPSTQSDFEIDNTTIECCRRNELLKYWRHEIKLYVILPSATIASTRQTSTNGMSMWECSMLAAKSSYGSSMFYHYIQKRKKKKLTWVRDRPRWNR